MPASSWGGEPRPRRRAVLDAASPVEAEAVALSLVLIVVTYSVVFSVGIWYVRKLMAKGPVPALLEPPKGVPSRPLSAAQLAAARAKGAS